MSDTKECGRPATVQFAWGGEIKKMCEHHVTPVVAIGRALGMAVMLAEYDGPETCKSHDPHPDDVEEQPNE